MAIRKGENGTVPTVYNWMQGVAADAGKWKIYEADNYGYPTGGVVAQGDNGFANNGFAGSWTPGSEPDVDVLTPESLTERKKYALVVFGPLIEDDPYYGDYCERYEGSFDVSTPLDVAKLYGYQEDYLQILNPSDASWISQYHIYNVAPVIVNTFGNRLATDKGVFDAIWDDKIADWEYSDTTVFAKTPDGHFLGFVYSQDERILRKFDKDSGAIILSSSAPHFSNWGFNASTPDQKQALSPDESQILLAAGGTRGLIIVNLSDLSWGQIFDTGGGAASWPAGAGFWADNGMIYSAKTNGNDSRLFRLNPATGANDEIYSDPGTFNNVNSIIPLTSNTFRMKCDGGVGEYIVTTPADPADPPTVTPADGEYFPNNMRNYFTSLSVDRTFYFDYNPGAFRVSRYTWPDGDVVWTDDYADWNGSQAYRDAPEEYSNGSEPISEPISEPYGSEPISEPDSTPSSPSDFDNDGIPDSEDPDIDNDGWPNEIDPDDYDPDNPGGTPPGSEPSGGSEPSSPSEPSTPSAGSGDSTPSGGSGGSAPSDGSGVSGGSNASTPSQASGGSSPSSPSQISGGSEPSSPSSPSGGSTPSGGSGGSNGSAPDWDFTVNLTGHTKDCLQLTIFIFAEGVDATQEQFETVQYTIDWGDGTQDTATGTMPTNTHTYAEGGPYNVVFSGFAPETGITHTDEDTIIMVACPSSSEPSLSSGSSTPSQPSDISEPSLSSEPSFASDPECAIQVSGSSPASGPPGTLVTVTGEGFLEAAGGAPVILFQAGSDGVGVAANVIDDNTIQFVMPGYPLVPGGVAIQVNGSECSNYAPGAYSAFTLTIETSEPSQPSDDSVPNGSEPSMGSDISEPSLPSAASQASTPSQPSEASAGSEDSAASGGSGGSGASEPYCCPEEPPKLAFFNRTQHTLDATAPTPDEGDCVDFYRLEMQAQDEYGAPVGEIFTATLVSISDGEDVIEVAVGQTVRVVDLERDTRYRGRWVAVND